jgi:folate-binding protein YgfZ
VALSRLAPTQDQYWALTGGLVVVDRQSVGLLRASGKDAVDLLDRLSTNDLSGLALGKGVSTVLTTNKGRVIDLLRVVHLGGHLLVLCSRDAVTRVSEWIDFYTFEEDVVVSEVTAEYFITGLVGPQALATAQQVAGAAAAGLTAYGAVDADVAGVKATVVRTDFLGEAAFDFIVAVSDGQALRDALAEHAEAVGPEALEAARIERGIPAFGSELNEDHNPLEAGLIDSISFNKGCYVGQEVVARLNTYDKVQRRLAVLNWPPDPALGGPVSAGDPVSGGDSVSVGDEIVGDDKVIGAITSVAAHPDGGFVGLAYVRRAFEGAEVAVGQSGIIATLKPADTPD